MSRFEEWYEAVGMGSITNAQRAWNGAIEACASEVEAAGCRGCPFVDDDDKSIHYPDCPIAMAAKLRGLP